MVNLQELWEKWKIEVLVLGSLTLQVILVLFGTSRKRSSGKLIISLLWVTYLSADLVATYALGTISCTLSCSTLSYARIDIIALWAPFLLLHLGGPDTITAFSIEDDQLWLRHAMTLLLQTIAAVHIFITSMPRAKLSSPAAHICFAGILKCGERTWALKKGSLKALRGIFRVPDGDVRLRAYLTKTLPDDPLEQLHQAYHLFEFFGQYFLDQNLRHELFMFFRALLPVIERGSSEFFQILGIELSFAYDILYTKALVVHSPSGCLLRVACFYSEFIAFFHFLASKKKDYQKADVAITYILLTAALALEIVALASLIFSDWTIAELRRPEDLERDGLSRSDRLKICFYRVLSRSRRIPLLCQEHHRWSNRIGQYSLLGYCFKNRRPIAWFDKLLKSLGMKEMWNEVRYTEFVQIQDGLKEFIVSHLKDIRADLQNEKKEKKKKRKEKKDEADFIRTISERRRDFSRNRGRRALERGKCSQLSWSTGGAFDVSVRVWHIATDICLIRLGGRSTGRSEGASDGEENHREWAKNLSHYLLYLLLVHPLAMSSISGIEVYEDICEEAMELLEPNFRDESEDVQRLMSSNRSSYDLLNEPVELAKELLKLPERERWKIVSEVLLEMLCFAAHNCKGSYHAQMLSYGGELLTFIWFLEAHLGLLEDYDNDDDDLQEKAESSAQPNEKSPLLP